MEVEFGLPDSLQNMRFWDKDGGFAGQCEPEKSCPQFGFSVTTENGVVHEFDIYRLHITVPPGGVPDRGGLAFHFPGEFNLNYINSVTYSDNYAGPDLDIRAAFVFDNILALRFGLGQSPPPGTIITLTAAMIRNPIQAAEYQLTGVMFNRFLFVVAGPVFSERFTIFPGDPTELAIEPSDPVTIHAGEIRIFKAIASDRFGNPLSELDCDWSFDPDSVVLGTIDEGYLQATTVGQGKVRATCGEMTAVSNMITVLPGEFNALILDIDETQFVGYPLLGPATLTVYDGYGNVVTDFDASVNPVTLVTDQGELTPSVLDSETDFVNGVADLTGKNIVYSGASCLANVHAASDTVTSLSTSVYFNGIDLSFYETPLDTVLVSADILTYYQFKNNGNLMPISPMEFLFQYSSNPDNCSGIRLLSPVPPGEEYKSGRATSCSNLEPLTYDTLLYELRAQYVLNDDTFMVTRSLEHEFFIIPDYELSYVPHSLSIDTVFEEQTVDSLSMRFSFINDILIPTSDLKARIQVWNENSGYFLTLSAKDKIEIIDDTLNCLFANVKIPSIHPSSFDEGFHNLKLVGRFEFPGSSIFSVELEDFDSLYIAKRTQITYVENSVAPTHVSAGDETAISFDLNVDGMSSVEVDLENTRLELLNGPYILSGALDADEVTLTAGVASLATEPIYIPGNLVGTALLPRLILYGTEFGQPRLDTIYFSADNIYVTAEATLQIVNTKLNTVNSPYVNTDQNFGIEVTIVNSTNQDADSVSVFIFAEGATDTLARMDNLAITAGSSHQVGLVLTAPDTPMPTYVYKAVVSAARATVLPAEDDVAAVVVQTPANIELQYVLLNTYEAYVDYGQQFNIAVLMRNLGEASADSGEVSLLSGGLDFGQPDSSTFRGEVDEYFPIPLTAPLETVTAELELKITEIPIDKNTGQAALVAISSVHIPVIVEPSDAELIISGHAEQNPLIVEGQETALFSMTLRNSAEGTINAIGLESMIVEIRDKFEGLVSPDQIIVEDRTGFYEDSTQMSLSVIENDRLTTEFVDYVISPGETRTLVFRAAFADAITLKEFSIDIDSRDINAVYASGPRIGQPVSVMGEFGGAFDIGANFVVTRPGSKEITMWKNPFNPNYESARFSYYLDRDSDVELILFTLTGEKAIEMSFAAGSNGGMAGTNEITWNGKNGQGHIVLNGVYILVLNNKTTGETFNRFKVAVVK
ncbi:MAG: hypothetical protein JW763_10550 [candidate division Zixibacteria bacterium]|nr:hypothetical protein [candidate division Zixibacteria bacterium]